MTIEGPARLAAIIVNFRTPDLVIEGLAALVPEVDPLTDRVVVVDNASGDGSADRIRAEIKRRGWSVVQVVESATNGGFSAGNNVGLGAVRAAAYLLLNSDSRVRPGAVARLLATLQRDAGLGLVGPRLEWPDGTPQVSCFRDHTPLSELIAGSATGPIRRWLARFEVPLPVQEGACEPDWTSFAAVMIRHEVVEGVGPMDEGYFMYYEDADYCRLARRAGWRIGHDPAARVIHLRGGSSPVKALTAARKRRPRYFYAARSRYFRKCHGWAGWLAANLLWTLGRTIAWLRETFGAKAPHTVERELLDIWTC